MADGTKLDGHHRVTLEKIFQHPVSHNIQWHDVLSLLEAVATTVREHDGRYHVTLGSEIGDDRQTPRDTNRRADGRRPPADAQGCRDRART